MKQKCLIYFPFYHTKIFKKHMQMLIFNIHIIKIAFLLIEHFQWKRLLPCTTAYSASTVCDAVLICVNESAVLFTTFCIININMGVCACAQITSYHYYENNNSDPHRPEACRPKYEQCYHKAHPGLRVIVEHILSTYLLHTLQLLFCSISSKQWIQV